MSESKLKLAKKTHKTDFGTYEDYSARFEDTKIETPLGTYICYHDGTFLDMTNKLMWIQAPWGMTFNGKKFKGEPVKLNWHDARKLFGYGGMIPHPSSALRKEAIKAYGYLEYKRGSCTVEFSGYRDWRLPTAEELLTLCLCVDTEHKSESKYNGYRTSLDTKSMELKEVLFPALLNRFITSWSANDIGSDLAWFLDGAHSPSLGDYKKDEEKPVLFVRS
jgi:hypothetical protein